MNPGTKATIEITQRKGDGTQLKVKIVGRIQEVQGPDGELGTMVLDAERFGNSGRARIHIDFRE